MSLPSFLFIVTASSTLCFSFFNLGSIYDSQYSCTKILYRRFLFLILLRMKEHMQKKPKILFLSCLAITLIVNLTLTTAHPGLANAQQQNNTSMQPQRTRSMATTTTTNATNVNIVLVHGTWVDGSSWSKVIPILQNAGHKVIAVQLPLHSLADDVATVKRAIDLVGKPVTLVGHSYGGEVITNAAYNNPNVTGLVYIAAFAPDVGQGEFSFIDPAKFPKGLLIKDTGGFLYLNPRLFREFFAQDVN